MDNNFSNIKERILQLAKNQGFSFENFFDKIGMSYGNFKGENKKRPINSDALVNILTLIPDANPTWLLTGKPPMLLSEQAPTQTAPVQNNDKYVTLLEEKLEDKQKQISLLEKNNALLEENKALLQEKVAKLEAEIQALKSAQSKSVNKSTQPTQSQPLIQPRR